MKYIKRYNESISNIQSIIDDVKDISLDLQDQDFKFIISTSTPDLNLREWPCFQGSLSITSVSPIYISLYKSPSIFFNYRDTKSFMDRLKSYIGTIPAYHIISIKTGTGINLINYDEMSNIKQNRLREINRVDIVISKFEI